MKLPHYLQDYATAQRHCFAVADDFGNLVPCKPVVWAFLFPDIQVMP